MPSEKPVAQTAPQNGKARLASAFPQTPSSVPLPPTNNTPYMSSPSTPAGPLTPSIYPSLDQLSAFSAPQTPTPQPNSYLAYQTPRNVPLPSGGETPYGSSAQTYQIDPALLESAHEDPQEAVEDVEMEDVSTYGSTGELEHSRSPGPDVLALSAVPTTPRNVPLPSGGSTPYSGVPATPMSAFARQQEPASPEEAINASSAPEMPETPRAIRPLDGPVSLRRRLLLRSAHKVMQEQISRRDMRRTMGVGSGLIGTPMRPRKAVERPVMEPMSPLMSPISEASTAKTYEAPETPSSAPSAEKQMLTPCRVALPSPGQTEYENSFSETNADAENAEEHTESVQDDYHNDGGHTSLAMYQTDFEEGEGDDDDAEGESDHEDEEGSQIESSISPVTPLEDFGENSEQDSIYFATADATDAVQFLSASTNQTLFQTRMVEVVSDDDDLVDRSLDVSPEMDENSDEELEEEHDGEAGQTQAQDDDLMDNDVSRDGEDIAEDDKENEPLVSDEEDEEGQVAGNDSVPVAFSSPSRAVRRPVAEEYYTPQPANRKTDRRVMFGRKSLSSIGGPAVRGTPRSELAPLKHAFGRLSLSEREIVKQESDSGVKREEDDQEGAKVGFFRYRRPRTIAHSPCCLQTLYSPRQRPYSPMHDLPLPPQEGFEAALAANASTPSASSRHPAMDVPITVSSDSETGTTPLQGLKNKLKNLRRKSTHANADVKDEEQPFNRRASLGLPGPSTPLAQHSQFEPRPVRSAAPINRFMPKLERGTEKGLTERELVADLAGDSGNVGQYDEELPDQGDRYLHRDGDDDMQEDQVDQDSVGAEEAEETHHITEVQEDGMRHEAEEEEDEDNEDDEPSVEEVVASPARTSVHKLQPHDAGTSMPGTPVFQGIREMLKTPKAAPGTPQFSGMRQMFALQPEVSTPEMSGIVDLFPEVGSTRRQEEQPTSELKGRKTAVSKLPARSRLAADTQGDASQVQKGVRGTTAAPRSRTKVAPEETKANRAVTSTATTTGIRRTRAQPAAETTSTDNKPRVTRTRVTQTLTASTSTDDQSLNSKAPPVRATRARTATVEPEEPSTSIGASKVASRTAVARTTRAKVTAPKLTESVVEEDGEIDPLEDITVPEPDPEDIKPMRKATRAPAATRTTVARPLATRSALPQPRGKVESPEPEKPKTRTRTATAGVSRPALKSSTEAEAVSASVAPPVTKKATRTATGSRLTAPTASSKARSAPPPVSAPPAARKTRAASSSVPPNEGVEAEAAAIPKRVTRARK
ncbi:hypothetical protein QFC22_001561 [Naganishia vaughanmartiniae]|uniref:Uncharacterized protein n=1 Tax=Naganishia vaughanmartiniae TaxID=1424756 RepID=A0ACC2XKX3_9TREE|nr:hypothetical protein QFC22_001561 [Naganishia vaughanmartiniae]